MNSFAKRLATSAAEGTAKTITIGGIVLAGIWYFGPSVTTYIGNLVTRDLETRALDYARAKLDFYTVIDKDWQPQDSYADCQTLSGKIIAGACEGWSGSPQASVGPVYEVSSEGT